MTTTRFRFIGESVEDYLHECPDDSDCERCDSKGYESEVA